VSSTSKWFVINEYFLIFCYSFLSLTKKIIDWSSLFFGICDLIILLLISFFFYWLFNKSYVPFNLVLQFYFVICYTFQFDPYSFDFFTPPFHISFFKKNIYPSIQVYFILLFSIWPFIFFFFVGVIFIFNLTFHAKLCVIFSFNFLFSSFTPLYRCYFFST